MNKGNKPTWWGVESDGVSSRTPVSLSWNDDRDGGLRSCWGCAFSHHGHCYREVIVPGGSSGGCIDTGLGERIWVGLP